MNGSHRHTQAGCGDVKSFAFSRVLWYEGEYETCVSCVMNLDPFKPRRSLRAVVEVVRGLTEEDLETLSVPEPRTALKRIGERHHALARCLAQGMPVVQAAAITGYDSEYITNLKGDKTFKELLVFYESRAEEHFNDLHGHLAGVAKDALVLLRERLEQDPDSMTDYELRELVRLGADRTGHGPSSTNVQVNVGLAAKLELARKRGMIDITPKKSAA